MKKLWLTYAWSDNEDGDVDGVIRAISHPDIEVQYDRVSLQAGSRLWRQLDEQISWSDLDAWAIFLTANSLRSEPCQEELSYALDRVLRTTGSQFPLIGIFPEPIDRQYIPSAIATRLYVSLRDPDWVARVRSSLTREGLPSTANRAPELEVRKRVAEDETFELEFWRISKPWNEFVAIVPLNDRDLVKWVHTAPRGYRPSAMMVPAFEATTNDGTRAVIGCQSRADSVDTARIVLTDWPSELIIGNQQDLVPLNVEALKTIPFSN